MLFRRALLDNVHHLVLIIFQNSKQLYTWRSNNSILKQIKKVYILF